MGVPEGMKSTETGTENMFLDKPSPPIHLHMFKRPLSQPLITCPSTVWSA